MKTKKFLALVLALVMAFSLVVPASADVYGEIPDKPDTLTHNDTGKHDTAKMTVYVTKGEETLVAAVGAIDSHMDATLELNYGTYPVDGTITAYGQTEERANMTTFTLNGTSNTSIKFENENEYFPGLAYLDTVEHYILFVNAMKATPTDIGDYTFKKATANKGITLTATNSATDDEDVKEVDKNWQDLKDEAFVETHDNDEDSFIKLAAGSYLQMANEKLTVVNSDLRLDNFSNRENVDANVTNAKDNLEYTTESTIAYQLLLKEGTQFSLGRSIAQVKQDLLVTMSNVTKSYAASILSNVYNNLDTSTEENLAKSLLVVFSEIAGLVQSTNASNPVVITFGRPATEVATSGSVVDGNTTATAAFAVDTTGGTTTYNIKTDVTTTTGNESTTTTTTKPVEVDTATAATVASEVQDAVANNEVLAQSAKAAVDAYIVPNNNSATFMAALESGGTTTAENVLQTTAAAKAIAKAAANVAAQNSVTVSQIAKAEVILQTELKAVDTTNDTPTVTYDIKPVAQLYKTVDETLKPVGDPVPLNNADINDGESFTFNIPVPAVLNTDYIKVTHKGATPDEDETGIYSPSGAKNQVRYVEVTVSHFSDFELEPIDADSVESGFEYARTLSLAEEIAINLYIHPSVPLTDAVEKEYTVKYFKTENENEGTAVTKSFDQLEIRTLDNKDCYYVKLAEFAAKQMTDSVTVRVYRNETLIKESTYTIKDYCDTVIAGSNSNYPTKLKNLCKAVLDYGTYSQEYFGYRVAYPAHGSFYNDISTVIVPEEYRGTSFTGADIGRMISLEYRVTLNFYVLPDAESNVSITVGANSGLEVVRKGETTIANKQYIRYAVTGFASSKLDQEVTVSVGDTVYTWSPLSYAYQNQNSSYANLKNVVRALYNYYSYAAIYFNAN